MYGFTGNIEKLTVENTNFRRVVYTAKNSQLVLMSLKPGEDIGEEVHNVDQFFRVEKGQGKVIIDGEESKIKAEDAVVVPAGAEHNVINTSKTKALKLYTIYSPPHHHDGVIHNTKEEALRNEEHFDGKTSN